MATQEEIKSDTVATKHSDKSVFVTCQLETPCDGKLTMCSKEVEQNGKPTEARAHTPVSV